MHVGGGHPAYSKRLHDLAELPGEIVLPPRWLIEEIRHAVEIGARWLPIKADCLYESAAAFAMLTRRRIPCRWCLGVKIHPFYSHAWVEALGIIVSGPTNTRLIFKVISQIETRIISD